MTPQILQSLIAAIGGGIIGWISKRPTRVDRDSASFARLESIVETLQEEVRETKKDGARLHQDLVASEQRSRELHADLLSTKAQLNIVEGLLREAISRLDRADIDTKELKASYEQTQSRQAQQSRQNP